MSDPTDSAASAAAPDRRARLILVIARETGVSPARLTDDVDLAEDLGVAGHDGADLLTAIGREFDIDLTVVDWAEYFGEETPWDPLQALWRSFFRQGREAPADASPPLRIRHLLRTVELGRWIAPD